MPLSCDPLARPERARQGTMDNQVEASTERVCDHLQHPNHPDRKLTDTKARSTVNRTVPRTWLSSIWLADVCICVMIVAIPNDLQVSAVLKRRFVERAWAPV